MENKLDYNFFLNETIQISFTNFLINLFVTLLLSYLTRYVYIKFSSSLSNKKDFANNFIILGIATCIIITIVKNSIALSLGLVGALSIVRFRAAIKEPEELAYLFLAIGIGLGLGADQRITTIVGFSIISCFLIVRNKFLNEDMMDENLFLTISCDNTKITNAKIIEILKQNCEEITMKRFNEKNDKTELSFKVSFKSFSNFDQLKQDLKSIDSSMEVLMIESKAIF